MRGRYICVNGRNVPVYEHTTRGGNSNSMQGIRNILRKQTSNPNTTLTRTSTKLILQENSFQFNGKKIPSNTWYSHGHKDGSSIC